ncbi:hypothetical protein [Helicobacter sp. 11S02596-1]|uniref:hypothetical protein n=1 Tax=Helicobacter sp. 11S02596-1 TaxID=1476194 RepID=UPI000BA7DD19|nr:hypothetical protein [Helicobacter sp. 11S02596-1]PAF41123.1 hypothetical protein BJI48_09005 [Helicobacter sp. 11S02596-1]
MKKKREIFWEAFAFGGLYERPHFSEAFGEIACRIRKQQASEYAKIDADYKKQKKKLMDNYKKNG